jgi:pyruvate/2-oxoglutarate dehydrogenase complex dihydrolipoamide dehydrogenase (E3) component
VVSSLVAAQLIIIMLDTSFDLIVIGAGSAGYNGAASAARQGLRVALIDGAKTLGGLCILRGCMPSKALLASANRFRATLTAAEFGVQVSGATADLEKIVARKNFHIDDFASYRQGQIQNGPFTFFHGRAKFLNSHEVEVSLLNGETIRLTGNHFLLATGSVLSPVSVDGLQETGFLHSDTALDLTTLPKSLVMLGAGAIGLEFAHYFSALGTKVTILQRSPQLLKGSDSDVADCLRESLEKRGIEIHTGVKLISATRSGEGKSITYEQDGETKTVMAEEIFHALGRKPNLQGMGLEVAGVTLQNGKLSVSQTQQTNVPHIYAAGDLCGPYEIVHLAIQQAEVAVRNMLRPATEPLEAMDYRLKLFVLFTQPEVAQVGLTEAEAKAAGEEFKTATYPFNDHGKSLVMGETEGFVKLITRASSGEIIGGSVIGPEAASLIHEIAAVMYFKGTAKDLASIPHYHPTLSEIWTYPAEDLM